MGHGSYSYDTHTSALAARASSSKEAVFAQRACHALMNPKGVRLRESRDSDEHPNTTPVVFALDVTGSMGQIPDLLARRELPKFMKVLGDCQVPDPQLLFMAVGDATCDGAPLQVGQFETTAELMDQWLTWSFLEGGGGGQGTESYELAMYFVAEHTDTDSFQKRKKPGYFFMTGDELPYPRVSKDQVEGYIGDTMDDDLPIEHVIAALSETYHPFFLVPDVGRAKKIEGRWRELLGDHVILMEGHELTCLVAGSIVALGENRVADLNALSPLLESAGATRDQIGAVLRAIAPWAATRGKTGASFPKSLSATVASAWKRLVR